MGECADHAAGPVVEVAVQVGQAAGPMAMQEKRLFQRADQALPLLVVRERGGGNERETAGDLLAASAGQQVGVLDVDAGVDERGRDPLGEVLQGVGDFRARPAGE